MVQHAIVAKNISKSFANKKVLKDVSFTVEKKPGIFGLIGLNGIGKTTFIKTMLGLLRPDEGDIKVMGHAPEKLEAKSQLAYLPEKLSPSPFLTGEEFLSLAVSMHGKQYNAEKAKKIAMELDFDHNALQIQAGKYSKGMGQKLGLISVFMVDAQLLILDEPMSGLDPRARIFLKKKMASYVKEGNTIFLSSHILSDVEEICNEMTIMHNGEIKYLGNVKDALKKHNSKNLEEAFLKFIES